jgi:hypothetical protein
LSTQKLKPEHAALQAKEVLMRTVVWLTVVAVLLIGAAAARADVPHLINYQGILTDPGTGDPVVGSTPAVISLYRGGTDLAGGTLVYTENVTLLTDGGGRFNHLIGSQATNADPAHTLSPSDLVTSDPVWIEVEISGAPLLPRPQLVTVAYGMAVSTVHGASGGTMGNAVGGPRQRLDGIR